MIDNFYVSNYKCLVDLRLPLTPIHVIIGQNDSGKTSLLEAIYALCRSTEQEIAAAFPGDWQDRELVFEGAEARNPLRSRLWCSERRRSVCRYLPS